MLRLEVDGAFRPLLQDGHFTPEDITVLTAAIEDALQVLRLVDRKDPAVALVAQRIIELARQGERDPKMLQDAVLESFNADPGVSGLYRQAVSIFARTRVGHARQIAPVRCGKSRRRVSHPPCRGTWQRCRQTPGLLATAHL
jgi:hypothetical protein